MNRLKDIHKDQPCWIIGCGESLSDLKAEMIGDGPVIALNRSIPKVESLGLTNKVYSMQKDGGERRRWPDKLDPSCKFMDCDNCKRVTRPKNATLLLHDKESKHCFHDHKDRIVFDLETLGIDRNEFSMYVAVRIAQYMGCDKVNFVSFDAHTENDMKGPYANQIPTIKPILSEVYHRFITPEPKISFGAMVSDLLRLRQCLKNSVINRDKYKCATVSDPSNAIVGLNALLDQIAKDGSDVAILVHQDMYFRHGWVDEVIRQLRKLPDDWVVAGIVGKDANGYFCGHLQDMRLPFRFFTEDIHSFPERASCFDECCIIVNLKTGFRFEPIIDGFDLYGTQAVLQAKEMGGSAWIINAFAEHYCLRPFTWIPDENFTQNYKKLHDRFEHLGERIDSTVLPSAAVDELNAA